ncbi:MAG: hypothetical protein V4708_17070 [Bacteroidota bacterium]
MNKYIAIILTGVLLTSCYQDFGNNEQANITSPNSLKGRVHRMSKACEYVMGMTKKQCIMELGFPTSIKELDDITIFDYFDDHNGYGHDHFTITFDKDTAMNWKVDSRGW